MTERYKVLAASMLGVARAEDLPEDLAKYLDGVNKLTEICGGELWSRQLIALIVMQYQEEQCPALREVSVGSDEELDASTEQLGEMIADAALEAASEDGCDEPQ